VAVDTGVSECDDRGATMSRSSRVTYRDSPVEATQTSTGALASYGETLTVETDSRLELLDITDRLAAAVGRSGVREGIVNLFSMHTTCSVFINEQQAALQTDIKRFLETIVDRDGDWLHNDPVHSDCDRLNADAHLRSLLLGPSLTLQINRGELVLGQWQRVLVAELDGPRARSIRVLALGMT
jgi:secondary thiamine-phosphate synthase enzyme